MICRQTGPEEKLGWIFSVFDKDQGGSIDASEIREVLIRSLPLFLRVLGSRRTRCEAMKLLNEHNISCKNSFSLFKMASCPIEEKEIDSCIKEVGSVYLYI